MSYTIKHNDIKYVVTDSKKLFALYPYVFIGYRFIRDTRYKLYKMNGMNVLFID